MTFAIERHDKNQVSVTVYGLSASVWGWKGIILEWELAMVFQYSKTKKAK